MFKVFSGGLKNMPKHKSGIVALQYFLLHFDFFGYLFVSRRQGVVARGPLRVVLLCVHMATLVSRAVSPREHRPRREKLYSKCVVQSAVSSTVSTKQVMPPPANVFYHSHDMCILPIFCFVPDCRTLMCVLRQW